MALYTDLPIYRTSYELLKQVTDKTRHFPRDFKYTMGTQLKNECMDLVLNIYRANISNKKNVHIQLILDRVQVIKLMLRLAKDMSFLSVKAFSEISGFVVSISKQATKWKEAMNHL